MKLFKPRAPKLADAAQIVATFPVETGRPGAIPTPVGLADAVSRVKQEIASLRAVIGAAKGLRSSSELATAVAESNADGRAKYIELERLQRQCHAGLIDLPAVEVVFKEYNRILARTQALQSEKQKREAADKAQAEIDHILQEVA